MRTFSQKIAGIDGTEATFLGYIVDNSEEIDPSRTRPAILILPGGGYAETSPREAEPVAIRMLSYGFQAFILHYSCAPSEYPVSTLQIAEAMSTIRANAEDWHIDPDAIVVAGFSAGGHAAALFTESWNTPLMAEHGFEPEQVKPNGLLLSYPVISMEAPYAHEGSVRNLLGNRADDPAWRERMSLERHVSEDVPPTFIWTTATDATVPPQNSLLFAQALLVAGVPCELHMFPEGAHGASLANGETAKAEKNVVPAAQVWPDLFNTWMGATFAQSLAWRK